MKTKKELINEIFQFDCDEIHDACEAVGHSTGWEYFEDELKTYNKGDCITLLQDPRYSITSI